MITPLRALDIVAWYAGRQYIGSAVWATPTAAHPEPGDHDDEHPDRLTPEALDERP